MYNGACYYGNKHVIDWLNTNYRSDTDYKRHGPCMAANNNQYGILDYLISVKDRNIGVAWVVALHKENEKLVDYCLAKNIRCQYDILKYKLSIEFLQTCKNKGFLYLKKIPLNGLEFKTILSYIDLGAMCTFCDRIARPLGKVFTSSNLGVINWGSMDQERYICKLISSGEESYHCKKKFIKLELEVNPTMTKKTYESSMNRLKSYKDEELKEF